jgi:Cu/Ag efflux protein CusF
VPIQAEGVVNSVQSDPPKVNLSHSPIPELGWDAMTMDFQVDGTVPLDRVTPGATVRFELRQQDDGPYVITAITPAGS